MAKDMSVSSKEIAEGAVEFWRQGLDSGEVDKRMKSTIMYGKISGLEFAESAELITAAVNSMGIEASRVVDVWSYLGDASASGADELGKAAQKTAAAAQQFGVSFEWMSAYIATLSEKTRLPAEQIGTALNTMFSRMYSIKTTGYNSEDETKYNDVAKALSTINVALTDGKGQWRDYSDIMIDVASKWNSLDDATQSYIATTMAGTRQQNMFLTLMSDMSGVTEGNSRAMELYNGAMNASGTATEKYAIYQESVTAAQDRMKASLEELYNLMSGELFKSGYNAITTLVEGFTGATEAVGGLNVTLPIAATGVLSLVLTINKFITAYNKAKAITRGAKLLDMFSSVGVSPILTAMGIAIAAITAIGGIVKAVQNANVYEAKDYSKEIEDLTNRSKKIKDLQNEYKNLSEKANRSAAEEQRLKQVTKELVGLVPSLSGLVDQNTGAFKDNAEAADQATAALKRYEEGLSKLTSAQAAEYLKDTNNQKEWNKVFQTEAEWKKRAEDYKKVADIMKNAYRFDENNKIQKFNEDYFKELWAAWEWEPDFEKKEKNWEKIKQYMDPNNWLLGEGDNARSVILVQTGKYYGNGGDFAQLLHEVLIDGINLESATKAANDARAEIWNYLKTAIQYSISDLPKLAQEEFMREMSIQFNKQNFNTDNIWNIIGRMMTMMNKKAQDYKKESIGTTEGEGQSAFDALLMSYFGGDEKNMLAKVKEKLGDKYDQFIKYVLENGAEALGKAFEILKNNKGDKTLMDALMDALMGSIGSDGKFDISGFIEKMNAIEAKTAETAESVSSNAEKISEALNKAFFEKKYEEEKDAGFFTGADDKEDWGVLDKLFNELTKLGKSASAEDIESTALGVLSAEADRLGVSVTDLVTDMAELYPVLFDILGVTGDLSSIFPDLESSMNIAKIKKYSSEWEDLDEIIADFGKGGKKAEAALKKVNKKVEDHAKLISAYNKANDKSKKGTEEYEEAMKTLADAMGVPVQVLEKDFAPAQKFVNEQTKNFTDGFSAMMSGLLNSFNNPNITTSNWEAVLGELAASGNSTAQAMLNAANAIRTMFLGASITVSGDMMTGYQFHVNGLNANSKTALDTSTKTGRGGGGGGGGGKSKEESAIQKLLKEMEATMKVIDYRRKMAQLGQEYHELRGEIQGVIMYMDKEIAIIKEQDTTAKQHIETLKKKIASFKGEQEELDDLTEQLEEYNQQVVQNKIDIEELTQAIQEQKDAIREMEIELRETIAQAIQDREDLEESMRDARIEMEDEILAAITERYEKERDLAIETAEAKREALQEEKNLISEQLRLRKELADEEDKQQELAELEAKLARISADPTRAKDEQKLREEIAKLREEIAWDIADKEAKAQQDAIDQQIESIDDYIEYVNNYYEELFEHPTRLINEMKEVMKLTDAEIIEWLAANSSEYQASSETMQESMRIGWQNTLDAVKGAIKTHWEEVEYIISQGDEYIINFLKENSADYKEAGKLQAEAYVDEWKKQLADLEAAYRKITGEIADTTAVSTKGATVTGSSGSGGNKNGSPSSPKTTEDTTPKDISSKYYVLVNGSRHGSFATNTEATVYKINMGNHYRKAAKSIPDKEDYYMGLSNSWFNAKVYKYKKGGLVDFTGPAWVDGTKSAPEAFLNASQTKHIAMLATALDKIMTTTMSSVASKDYYNNNTGGNVTFEGDIVVQVERLESEQDYEEMASRVGNVILKKLGKNMVVGGLRMR